MTRGITKNFIVTTVTNFVDDTVDVTGTDCDVENGDLFIYKDGVTVAVFAKDIWTHVKATG